MKKKLTMVAAIVVACSGLVAFFWHREFVSQCHSGPATSYKLNVQISDKVIVYSVEPTASISNLTDEIKQDFPLGVESGKMVAISLIKIEGPSSVNNSNLFSPASRSEFHEQSIKIGRYYALVSKVGNSELEAKEFGSDTCQSFQTFDDLLHDVLPRLIKMTRPVVERDDFLKSGESGN